MSVDVAENLFIFLYLHNMKTKRYLSVKTQVFVMGRHLENQSPYLGSFCYWGLVDGGGEKWHVVIDILGEKRDLVANWQCVNFQIVIR